MCCQPVLVVAVADVGGNIGGTGDGAMNLSYQIMSRDAWEHHIPSMA